METIRHGSLKGSTGVFKAKWHDAVCESAPRTNERYFKLISTTNNNLVVSREAIHKGENLVPCTLIYDLVNKWCGEVVFGTSFVQIAKVGTNTNGALLFEDGNWVGHPSGIFNGLNETSLPELVYFSFDGVTSRRMDGSQLLTNWNGIRPCVDVMFDNGRIESGHF